MTRIINLTAVSLIFGILFLLVTSSVYAQRGGRGGGAVVARGTGIGGAPSGVGGVGPSRRTAVIAGAARDGRIGNGRGGYGGNFAHPVAAVGVARRVPIGTVIEVLPTDCSMQFISEMEYYYCSGQYYQPMGSDDNQIYVAAEPYVPEY